MPYTVCSVWKDLPDNLFLRLEACLDAVHHSGIEEKKTIVFFRADDVAVPSVNFSRLISLFRQYRLPLCLAVVPGWLTRRRWSCLKSLTGDDQSLWCWHQHGWRHVNHSREGKKCEFGPDRSVFQIEKDLKKGLGRLEHIMGENVYPVFTPPWNRCDDNTLNLLKRLGYKAVSRGFSTRSGNQQTIAEYNVNLDLHTRKEKKPNTGWSNLFNELNKTLANGMCGIMIHHQRMNNNAFLFLEYLLKCLAARKEIRIVHFKDMSVGC